jgi:protein phosphatase
MELASVFEMVALSDAGVVRTNNEDAVSISPACGVAILADGMGGYNAGEVASHMATSLLGGGLEKQLGLLNDEKQVARLHRILRTEIARVNSAIYRAAQKKPQYAGMGTTLVASIFCDNRLIVAHVGDSRLYRFRDNHLTLLTKDHSLLQEQIDAGLLTASQAWQAQHKNLVTRAVGVDPEVTPEIHDHQVLAGDIYLVCSDGLNDMVTDDEIGQAIGLLSANLDLCATQLVQMANDNGGRDNVSVILVKIKKAYPAIRTRWWRRLLFRF